MLYPRHCFRLENPASDFPQRALHVAVLSTFALSLPLLDLLGRHATFFVVHRSRPTDLLALVLILVIVVPLLLIAGEAVAERVSHRAGRAVHFLLLFLLSAAALLSMLRGAEGADGRAMVTAAAILGFGAAVLAARSQAFRTFLSFLSPVLLLAPALFLFFSPTKKLLFPDRSQAVVPVQVAATTPVVLVVFDELALPHLMDESLRIDPVLYPNFAHLAERSYWFRNATTVAQSTRFAVPAILTGNYPDADRLPIFEDYPRNLFTLLSASHEMRVTESLTALCPPGLCRRRSSALDWLANLENLLRDVAVVYPHVLLPPDLTTGLPSITDNWENFDRRIDWQFGRQGKFLSFVDAIREGKAATLHFIHSILPHVPWQYLPSGKNYGGTGVRLPNWGIRAGKWFDDEWLVRQNFQRYLLQLRYVDKIVGEMVGALEEGGLYDQSLIIVTADHGVSFRPRVYRRQVRKENFHEIMPVPLLIKIPGQQQGVLSDENAETIDILPTIARVLGLENPPWPMDGRSLIDPDTGPRPKKLVFKSARRRGRREEHDPAVFIDKRIEAVRRTIGIFGSGTDPDAVFRIGPRPELIGRPVSELEAAGTARADAFVSGSKSYNHVDLDGSFLPARISGMLRLPAGHRRSLAIGINGTIQAVTRTFDTDSKPARFTAMVPERAFVVGRNTVEIFDLTGARPSVRIGARQAEAKDPTDGRAARIFDDGFESGDFSAWQSKSP